MRNTLISRTMCITDPRSGQCSTPCSADASQTEVTRRKEEDA